MDPFVSRIGDVTIQRVPSQNTSSEKPKDEPPSERGLATMEDLLPGKAFVLFSYS